MQCARGNVHMWCSAHVVQCQVVQCTPWCSVHHGAVHTWCTAHVAHVAHVVQYVVQCTCGAVHTWCGSHVVRCRVMQRGDTWGGHEGHMGGEHEG